MYTGPNIVRDGLILQFDPANIKCFRGEPTVNIFPRSADSLIFTYAFNGTNYGFGSSTNMQQVIDNTQRFDNRASITKVSRINSGVSQADYVYIGLPSPSNSTRVLSFWYYGTYGTSLQPYNNDGYESIYYLDNNNVWQGGNQFQDVPVKIKEWQKITLKIVNNGTGGTGLSWMILHSNQWGATLDNTEYWLFTMCQLEEKDHSTPYTSTSRGTTVATGGGLIDLSNNGNHGEIVNNILYDSNNCGSLKFDATNAYINVNNLSSITNGTISFWSKMDDTSNWLFMTGQTVYYYILATSGLGNFYHENIGNNTLINYVDGLVNNTPPSDLGWHYITLTGVNLSSWTIFNIGIYSGTGFKYNGKMSNIMFYDRVLSQSEIQQNYNATKTRFNNL